MDLGVYLRIFSRFKLLLLAGLAFATLAAVLTVAHVSFSGGTPSIDFRQGVEYQSGSTLLVTQEGFPWGRAVLDEMVAAQPSIKPVVTSNGAVVVSGHPLASEAGRLAFEKGGNVVDAMIAVSFALGVLFLGLRPSTAPPVNVETVLFGSILAISPDDLILVGFVGGLTALLLAFTWGKLAYATFDPDLAVLSGVPVAALDYMLLALTAVVISPRLVLPLVAAWALGREVWFGVRAQQVGRRLESEGGLPSDEVAVRPSGRIERSDGDAVFPKYREAVEAAPDDCSFPWSDIVDIRDFAGAKIFAEIGDHRPLAFDIFA